MTKKRKTRLEKIRTEERRTNSGITRNMAEFSYTFVKGELGLNGYSDVKSGININKHEKTGRTDILASSLKDLLKTLIIATIIFALEAMLYFAWK